MRKFLAKLFGPSTRTMVRELATPSFLASRISVLRKTIRTIKRLDQKARDKLGIKRPYPVSLGLSGGVVYEANDPKYIVKVTTDRNEYEQAKHLRSETGIKHLVKIKNVKKLPDKVYVITLEKLRPLTSSEHKVLEHIFDQPLVESEGASVGYDEFLERIYKIHDQFHKVTHLPSSDFVKKLVIQAEEAIQELDRHGLVHSDLHADNLMIAPDGTLKVIDLGGF